MTTDEYIEQSLLAEQEAKSKRERSGKFSPSQFGRCFRAQYWNRKNEPVSNPPNVESLKRFEEGTATHQLIQKRLPKGMVEVKIDTEDVIGYADIVEEDGVIDIKSAEEWKYKRYHNIPTEIFIEKNPKHFLQCGWYACMLRKKYIRIRSNVTGSLSVYTIHEQLTIDWKDKIQHEIDMLREYWKKDELPPPEPRAFGGKECNYCSFKEKCNDLVTHG